MLLKKLIFILFIYTTANIASAQQKRLKTGVYYPGLILAVDEKHQVISGYFETYKDYDATTGKPIGFCRFFIKGEWAKDSIRFSAFYPEWDDSILGRIYLRGDTAIDIKTQSEPPCWSYVEDANIVYTGMPFDFDHNANWLEIGMINKNNVDIYADYGNEKLAPIATAKFKDCVKVLARRKGWLKIEYIKGEDGNAIGWIKSTFFD